jgi:hypothetical protein
MPNHRPLPPFERLHELFEVIEIPEEKYGVWSGLVRKVSRGNQLAGSMAGHPDPNANNLDRIDWVVKVDGSLYYASRLIYYMTSGKDPGDIQVDHADQNWLNNNTWNLRLDDDRSIQNINKPIYKNNKSGVVGVCWFKPRGTWQARVWIDGRNQCLGYFTCKIEAARAVRDKWIELGWDKLGRKLPDLDKVECGCHHCAPHNF